MSDTGDQASRYSLFDLGSASEAETIMVDDDAPGDPAIGDINESDPLENGTSAHPYDSLQEAIDVASEGAFIVVRPGTYYENIHLLNKRVQLVGDDPNAFGIPTIMGDYSSPTIVINGSQDVTHGISGFVITGGINGINCHASNLTVTHCVIAGNEGFGLSCQDSRVVITNCTITDNSGFSEGGGLRLFEGSEVSMLNSILWNNHPSNIHVYADASLRVRYSNISTWFKSG